MVASTKTVQCYPNNKPWVKQGVKAVLNQKKAFRSQYKEEMKAAQREVKRCLNEAKDCYRQKVEQKLEENNMRDVWEGVRTITGRKARTSPEGGGVERANDLNTIFNRFSHSTQPSTVPAACSSPFPFPFRSPSPHLQSHSTAAPPTPNLFRPRVQDPLQFVYQAAVGVEDAILYLLHRAHSHLDLGSGTVRILFLDFSSAFNTIQPLAFQEELTRLRVDPCLVAWISSYLTDSMSG